MEVEETKTTIADNESVLQRSKTSSVVEEPLPSKDDAENEDKDGHELEIQYASGSRLAIITLGVCLGLFVVALDTSIISTVIPTITTVFDSLGDVGWYGSAYLLVLASLQPSFGKIYTVFNLKAVYLISLIVFEVGSVVCAAATSSLMFIIGRAIAGLGASALLSGGMNIIAFAVPLEKRAAYNAGVSSMFTIASIAGPLLGGAFTDEVSWRWSFWINLPVGGLAFFIVGFFFTAPARKSQLTFKEKMAKLDFFGALCFVGGTICLLLALQWGGATYAWTDSRVWGLFLGFGLIMPIFAYIQVKRGKGATIPVSIIKQRTVLISTLYSFLYSMASYTQIYYLPLYFQAVENISAVGSGIRLIPYLVFNTFAAILMGMYVNRTGYYYYLLWIGATFYTVGSGLLSTLGLNSSTAQWLPYEIITGFGRGSGQIPFVAVQVVLTPEEVPIGSSLVMLSTSLGGAVALSISQSIFNNDLLKELTKYAPSIDPDIVLNSGATQFSDLVPADALSGVLQAYSKAIDTVLIPPIAFAGLSLVLALGIERLNVKARKQSANVTAESEKSEKAEA
ncbi:putative major facilitator superfamily transporter [Lentinula raphanica]|uniref:Major facilitator superfamily transporter n=1 Tax=Lentinula raphanica TaxID=153919 RepID=A0AA38P7W0_9AGAR|nr:putative major facilitator superfamily transporter [Lentinula raphanica]KAJ3818968.1 putative major facilitator superfamily transporter [Lentinula raphanica]KAJ3837935.1 putative major facilitator superfamily transporter [Lentinula raphanica]